MMEPSITLYYDIVSPFSYIALYALKVIALESCQN